MADNVMKAEKHQTFYHYVLDIMMAMAAVMIAVLYISAARADTLIKTLPDKGAVTISGTVAEIKDSNHFTLKDKEGATINVESKNSVGVIAGETVTVEGEVQKNTAGGGKKLWPVRSIHLMPEAHKIKTLPYNYS